ncbi:unnamed protein product [Gongylonema pulchrum]|uniref:Apple domain-containing protein n=1 Tax=Gongylonema pulchrum TaxID=637853 RepID=A0A183D6N3_9BILA|nr:unnamed protein product [Gongylonema pulchrum]
MQIDCRSVMYYYDTAECILNAENQATNKSLITNDTLNMRVDYFENNCLDVNCSNDSTTHWIKVERFVISNKHDVFIEQVTRDQCISFCIVRSFSSTSL